MAEDEKGKDEESSEGKKKSGGALKLIIVILLLLIILGVLGGAGYMFFMKPKPDAAAEVQPAKKAAAPKKEVKEGGGIGSLYPLENFIVNMADTGGTRYLRVTLQLELDDTKKFAEALDMRKPQLRDAILTVLASKRYEEVSSAQGKLILKQELLRRLNSLVTEGTIVNIYFTEFVAQ
ncbi:flagellar basal body-associated protein FliL [Denitrovibrio acetiphilus DSM 12809]|uniref:Flagellar protein FliL n=1 Tax=Denitrovibrio acetiphilus (strain DSM 12809 / NBRC 114555 / N2460) TaxID=522772 RepID=D4H2N1_DENA2|nr:flagellar basal body-associated FliL family protein [Denitrovibrio acetiphilus]ADD67092.1 flagellar basal body-associated protein FliL [Denitrovibrio acetiphilus DSM 12809]